MSEANKAIVQQFVDEFWNKGDLTTAEKFLAADSFRHDPATPDVGRGPEGEKQPAVIYRGAFPDLHLTLEDMLADGEKVVLRWTARGTHKGDLRGAAPTGRRFEVSGITILRLSGGKIAEAWVNWDALGLMRQLGVQSAAAAGA